MYILFRSFIIFILGINFIRANQCDCFCRNKLLFKLYPQSCDECTIEYCKNNNMRGIAGGCFFGQRTVQCRKYNDVPPIFVA
ncbi:unnamed protein product [Adineta ricciae]|uniref:Uncharacterized protein n=1 Tax=Adineta ricciae TaxID=249248 RepID=A0A814M2E8_ADIRI|nr:unnamed protein product [Adineta ricciae]